MRMKESFDAKTLPITFYAHAMEFIDRNCYDKRCAVIFEAVVKDRIHMFITGELPSELPKAAKESRYFPELWKSFQKGGLDDTDFLTQKAMYLAQASNAELDLMLQSFARAKEIWRAKNDWWEITVYPAADFAPESKDTCALSFSANDQTDDEFPFDIKPVSEKTEQTLYKLYTPYIDGKTTGTYLSDLSDRDADRTDKIVSGTTFSRANVYYVGAGLCCCLLDGLGNPTAFFDMGVESSYSNKQLRKYNNAAYPAMTNMLRASLTAIIQILVATPNLDVIISHWHTDHILILSHVANQFMTNQLFANFWQQVRITAPGVINKKGWAHTHATLVQGAMQAAHNGANYKISKYKNLNRTIWLAAPCPNINLFKCDRNDAAIGTPNHHDHGIGAQVRFTSQNIVLFAGDCAYDTVSVSNPNARVLNRAGHGYNGLVVSHHGGKYTHTTAQNKNQYIPVPAGQAPAVYSANGVAYGHPVAANVTSYQNAGWNNVLIHLLAAAGQNQYLLN